MHTNQNANKGGIKGSRGAGGCVVSYLSWRMSSSSEKTRRRFLCVCLIHNQCVCVCMCVMYLCDSV